MTTRPARRPVETVATRARLPARPTTSRDSSRDDEATVGAERRGQGGRLGGGHRQDPDDHLAEQAGRRGARRPHRQRAAGRGGGRDEQAGRRDRPAADIHVTSRPRKATLADSWALVPAISFPGAPEIETAGVAGWRETPWPRLAAGRREGRAVASRAT